MTFISRGVRPPPAALDSSTRALKVCVRLFDLPGTATKDLGTEGGQETEGIITGSGGY
ncbi:uncharacterized protein G2W53_024347 [Senna tora]|uniref:Uncharacterized protein n=1 Tax=Senna tora TaxID=362788 RepID=A0A834TBE7_9FABA|nr:uncharacterized protein G2W53_024347 [Senna tora]